MMNLRNKILFPWERRKKGEGGGKERKKDTECARERFFLREITTWGRKTQGPSQTWAGGPALADSLAVGMMEFPSAPGLRVNQS